MAVLLTVDHRLCVLASGSLMIEILPCFKLISVSALHLGQNKGKCINTVSLRTFILVLPPHTGQMTHFFCLGTLNQGFLLFSRPELYHEEVCLYSGYCMKPLRFVLSAKLKSFSSRTTSYRGINSGISLCSILIRVNSPV